MMMLFGSFGFLMMLLFFLALIGAALWLVSILFPRPGNDAGEKSGAMWRGPLPPLPPNASETPLDILKRRYARGELTKAEYEEMRRDLLSN